jgi:hypothetical protein
VRPVKRMPKVRGYGGSADVSPVPKLAQIERKNIVGMRTLVLAMTWCSSCSSILTWPHSMWRTTTSSSCCPI